MNILFVTDTDISPLSGGINRIVSLLAGGFARLPGYKCFLAYADGSKDATATRFEKKIKIAAQSVRPAFSDFITANRIDAVIVSTASKQNIKFLLPELQRIIKGEPVPVYFWYHSMPGYELAGISGRVARYRIVHQKNKFLTAEKWMLGLLNNPPCRAILEKFLRKKYAFICNHADKVILLSDGYIAPFARYARLPCTAGLVAIGNSLSFDFFATSEEIKAKEKIVLIVARMDEDSKRISMALRIWRLVEKYGKSNDWKLVIVGSGDDEQYCRQWAQKRKLQNVVFEGKQNPVSYYRQASVFMMTSAHEGFPVTLLEALQMGVVPVAFDSFSAVHDIIQDGHNGLLVPNNDIKTYAAQLIRLMENEPLRHTMAQNAVESSGRFELSGVIKAWVTLLALK
ncbi:MAG: glycosyltransferase [Prevotellaceae bacterium]|jgi:glycosyltransferase involved in cell wall biosynthesis|nr:glycosyltransferase [Prevotellaceae bacterium]